MFIFASFLGVAGQPPPFYTAAALGELVEDLSDDLIQHYYTAGFTAIQILLLLHMRHEISIGIRRIRQIIRRLRVRRVDRRSNVNDIINAITFELRGSGQNLGYRAMWRRLRIRHEISATQRVVRELLSAMDPDGVERRSNRRLHRRRYVNRGPNHVIHIDGYDKLKPYGFAVHSAIDGFSRKVLWLKVGRSNNNPRYITRFFLDYISLINGVPRIVRSDRGTENCQIRDVQIALRWYHDDEFHRYKSFMYGRSTSNQRIESWWGHVGRLSSRFWIELFKQFRDNGGLDNTNPIHVEALRFCFTNLIQRDLDLVVQEWNQHRIRSQANEESPYGIPDLMYYVPEIYGAEDNKMPLAYSLDEVQETANNISLDFPPYGCSQEFVEVVNQYVGDVHNFQLPESVEEATELYEYLVNLL